MMQQLLKIRWFEEVEFVSFHEDDHFPKAMKTTSRWSDALEVTYDVDATFRKNGKSRTLELTYKSEKQTDPTVRQAPKGTVRYGVTIITWNNGDAAGKAKWKDNEDGADWDGESEAAVLGGREPTTPKGERSVIVKQRPQQREFRDALFQLDKQCALTGEKCREALQAAHLVPAAKEGYEQIENGILLRADLHLLFDAGLIWLEVSDGHADVNYSPNDLSERYIADLKGKRLSAETFRRVKNALLARAKLPGGRGRDHVK